jgi:arabinogalactan endo-1,4-beta-galactosidase
MKIKLWVIYLFFLMSVTIHSEGNATTFANGADVSWLTQMESSGKKFYDAAGTQTECMALLKSLGMNSIRLRVWVNPSAGWCNAQDVLAKAIRANNLGMRILIDFHYSDTWADPSNQTKPAAWTSLTFANLKIAVATHTTDVLNLLKTNGITPEWVQVGNETSNGMLWQDGKASTSMANYAALTNAGYDAVKAVFPSAKVIVHLNNGYSNSLFRWIFDGLKNNGGKYDVIGLSVYPGWYTTANDWQNCNIACLANMNDMVSRYGKEVMVVECGMSWDSPVACKSFLDDLILKTKSVTGGKGLGVFYWEPECYGGWSGYSLGAFDNSGKPTIALNAFNTQTNVEPVTDTGLKIQWNKRQDKLSFSYPVSNIIVTDLSGKCFVQQKEVSIIDTHLFPKGIYIINVTLKSNSKVYQFKIIRN